MKSAQVILRNQKITANDMTSIVALAPHLVVVFGAPEFFEDLTLGKQLRAFVPYAQIVGCSTAGEISNGGVTENTLVVTGIRFDKAKIRCAASSHSGLGHSMSAGEKLAAELNAKDLRGIFVLAPGLNINGNSLIEGLQAKSNKGVVITGGLAGDSGRFQNTLTLFNDKVGNDLLVGVGFYGQGFELQFGSVGGWEPMGQPMKVTKSIGNIMFELDGKPALEVYRRQLGDRAKELPGITLTFPFAILDSQKITIRTPLSINEANGSLVMGGDVPKGATVSMMKAQTASLVRGAADAAKTAIAKGHQGTSISFLISCIGRKLVMGNEVGQEVKAASAVLKSEHIAGYYSNGEIAPSGFVDDCRLHNQTMTITRIQE